MKGARNCMCMTSPRTVCHTSGLPRREGPGGMAGEGRGAMGSVPGLPPSPTHAPSMRVGEEEREEGRERDAGCGSTTGDRASMRISDRMAWGCGLARGVRAVGGSAWRGGRTPIIACGDSVGLPKSALRDQGLVGGSAGGGRRAGEGCLLSCATLAGEPGSRGVVTEPRFALGVAGFPLPLSGPTVPERLPFGLDSFVSALPAVLALPRRAVCMGRGEPGPLPDEGRMQGEGGLLEGPGDSMGEAGERSPFSVAGVLVAGTERGGGGAARGLHLNASPSPRPPDDAASCLSLDLGFRLA